MQSPWQIKDFIPDPDTGKDRWQIHKIFKGGMGVVYIVYDNEWQEVFAVKTYLDKLKDELAKEQFKKEAEKWINLDRHENVVWAKHIYSIQNRLYLFLEYVPGGDLSKWIGDSRLDLKQVLNFAIQFCYGIEHAYAKGIQAHLDIKPPNCLITEDGILKISDFGLAKALGDEMVQSGGTLPYMPPEQFMDIKHVDIRTDIYSFGAMLFEMISGRLPFYGSSYKEFQEKHQQAPVPEISAFSDKKHFPLTNVIHKCLAKSASDRYPNFEAVQQELIAIYKHFFKKMPPVPSKTEALNAIDLRNKGVSLGELGHIDEEIGCYNQALKIDPSDAKIWTNKGTALGNLGRFEEALLCHEKAISIDPLYAVAWYGKGVELVKMGQDKEAIVCFDQALDIDPQLVQAWNNKGNALRRLSRDKEALVCFDQALNLAPRLAVAWINKAATLDELGYDEEALGCYNRALELDPTNPQFGPIWFYKGQKLLFAGDYGKALECIDNSLNITPRNALAWYLKGTTLRKLKHYEKALACYTQALHIDSQSAQFWYDRGAVLGDLGRFSEEIESYDKALSINPENANIWSDKGSALFNLGQIEAALISVEKALDIDPQLAQAWNNKGVASAYLGYFQDAVNSFKEAQRLGFPISEKIIEMCLKALKQQNQ
ncbi:MAG: hypothetical protein CV087_22305 [Candidatus Brocadia sp. WS118]|nr:MAG: hypothetical protein CV087_22305 [Candidatus Brocadia sp. WS118]